MFEGLQVLWSEEKNQLLKDLRHLSFEEVMNAIENNRVLADVSHPDLECSHQRILVVDIGGYACGVPYVRDDKSVFLKTIYRNREFKRKFMRSI